MMCENFSPLSCKTFEIWGGGAESTPPPADFKHLQTLPVIGLIWYLSKSVFSRFQVPMYMNSFRGHFWIFFISFSMPDFGRLRSFPLNIHFCLLTCSLLSFHDMLLLGKDAFLHADHGYAETHQHQELLREPKGNRFSTL